MAIVLDASAALGVARPQGLADIVILGPVAPPLMWSEALSALRQARWRGDISDELASATRAALLAAPIERRAPRRLYETAWSVAERFGWAKTYDAEYIALAQLLGCALLTRDARLKRRAGGLVEIVGPSEL